MLRQARADVGRVDARLVQCSPRTELLDVGRGERLAELPAPSSCWSPIAAVAVVTSPSCLDVGRVAHVLETAPCCAKPAPMPGSW